MKNKKIIIPLVFVVLLAVLLVVVLNTGEKKEEPVKSDATPAADYNTTYLFDFGADSLSYIEVNPGNSESYAFTKNDDKWILEGAGHVSISTGSVNSLASLISDLSYGDSITDGSVTMENCGITADSRSVKIVCDKGEITVFAGITTTDGLWTYLMTDSSDAVYLAETASVEKLFVPLNEYRNGAALRLDFETVNSITIKNDDTIVFEKGATDADSAVFNSWRMTSPIKVGARDEQITALILDPLENINIIDFASDSGDFANYGLGSKDRYITLKDSSGKSQTVYFSAQKDGRYYISIDSNKTIYAISYEAAPYVALETSEVFDRNIHLVKMADISNVTLKGEGYDYKIEFDKDGGKINGTQVTADVMNQKVFASVCGLFADDILPAASGETKVTLTFNYHNSKSDVITFADYNERYYSVSKNGTVKYMILKAKISDLAKVLDECKQEK